MKKNQMKYIVVSWVEPIKRHAMMKCHTLKEAKAIWKSDKNKVIGRIL